MKYHVKFGEAPAEPFELVELDGGGFELRDHDGNVCVVDDASLPGGASSLIVEGRSHRIIARRDGSDIEIQTERDTIIVRVETDRERAVRRTRRQGASEGGPKVVTSQMAGIVVRVLAEPGTVVQVGEPLLVVEAMKMENEVRATSHGTVKEVHVEPKQTVGVGEKLVTIDASESAGAS